MSKLDLNESILSTPIQNLDEARVLRKAGYADVPLDAAHILAEDPIVALSDYGVASQSYYSRKNVTGDPVPGVKSDVLVRRDIAESLARVNEFISSSEWLTRHYKGRIELFVDDGLRSIGLQTKVHDSIYPNFLRTLHPDWSEDEVNEERDRRVAKPSTSSPHASGGAVDVKLRRIDDCEPISYGYDHANKLTIQTDYFENYDGDDAHRLSRRIAFHILSSAGLVNNPEEVWHYGRGDKLSHAVSEAILPSGIIVPAYYGPVEGAPELEQ